VVPKTVNKIHEYAFADCNDIEEIILPDHRIEFGDYCFSCCKKLKRVNLPDDMEYLSYGMFANSGIEEFVFPSKLKCLGFKTFLGTNLKSFVLPLNLERIGMPYFPNEIDEFMIPTTVKCQVSKYDLAGCKVKHAVVFPENSYIDLDKDYGYLELFSAYYDDANTLLYSRQNKHDDEIFIKAVESKVLLKRHLVHIAATRLFVYNDNLSDTARAFYDEVLRKNRKAAILSFVNSGNFEYINLLIENNYVSTRDLKHIAEAAESTVSKSNT
jgi:hypothetical protein